MNQLQVDTVSHLVLQVYLGPTGEKKLHHLHVTTITSQHEGSLVILFRQNVKVLMVYTCCKTIITWSSQIAIILLSSGYVHHCYYSCTHTSRTMLILKPCFQILGKREKGFVHTVHACTVVTFIPLHYTKRTANFSLSAEKPHCIMRHIWKAWKSEQPSYLAAVCIISLKVISEL